MTDGRKRALEAQSLLSCSVFTQMVKELRCRGLVDEAVWIPMLSIASDMAAMSGTTRERFHEMVNDYFNAVDEREAKKRRMAS